MGYMGYNWAGDVFAGYVESLETRLDAPGRRGASGPSAAPTGPGRGPA